MDGYEYGRCTTPLPQYLWRITTPTGEQFEKVASEWYVSQYWGSCNAKTQGWQAECLRFVPDSKIFETITAAKGG